MFNLIPQPQQEITALLQSVLHNARVHYNLDNYALKENFENGQVQVECAIHDRQSGQSSHICGQGVGLIDAFFHAFIALHSEAYPSIRNLRVADFQLKTKPQSGNDATATDAVAEVTLILANHDGQEFVFEHASPSVTRSSLHVVLQGMEFFLNCERAFIAVYRALQHAQKEQRPDSIDLYTRQLALLVQATSYSDVIVQMRQQLHMARS